MQRGAGEVRAAIGGREWTGPTAGVAPGYVQVNLVVMRDADAFDFLRFCYATEAVPGTRGLRAGLPGAWRS